MAQRVHQFFTCRKFDVGVVEGGIATAFQLANLRGRHNVFSSQRGNVQPGVLAQAFQKIAVFSGPLGRAHGTLWGSAYLFLIKEILVFYIRNSNLG